MDGIFFDEATVDPASADETYMKNASAFARSAIPASTIIFNPGALDDPSYFADADLIVEFEDAYSNYNPTSTPQSIPAADRSKSAVLIHDTPSSADITNLVHTAIADKIGSIYLSGTSHVYCSMTLFDEALC